jgi:hypothetical protein
VQNNVGRDIVMRSRAKCVFVIGGAVYVAERQVEKLREGPECMFWMLEILTG